MYQLMYPVAHMGIAVGGVWAGEKIFRRLARRPELNHRWRTDVDYRLVALGALVPDAIDKPLYRLTSIPSDHTIGHTLLFSLALIAAGALLARRGEPRILSLGLGSLSHPLVDPVIAYPQTLFWPLLGWGFVPSPGIPGWYLRAIDAGLVVVAAAVWWRRSAGFRERARRFVQAGVL